MRKFRANANDVNQ